MSALSCCRLCFLALFRATLNFYTLLPAHHRRLYLPLLPARRARRLFRDAAVHRAAAFSAQGAVPARAAAACRASARPSAAGARLPRAACCAPAATLHAAACTACNRSLAAGKIPWLGGRRPSPWLTAPAAGMATACSSISFRQNTMAWPSPAVLALVLFFLISSMARRFIISMNEQRRTARCRTPSYLDLGGAAAPRLQAMSHRRLLHLAPGIRYLHILDKPGTFCAAGNRHLMLCSDLLPAPPLRAARAMKVFQGAHQLPVLLRAVRACALPSPAAALYRLSMLQLPPTLQLPCATTLPL